ncbi:hypothetical protein BDQ17DRAFT_1426544 [Cyathus striatus]|nr:hypothetical protein BDQ17DRAFT_1426544 [Cyathus striatus]
MLKVPSEIWHHIASFLPDASVHDLLSLNRVFFYLSMGIRHRELVLNVYDHSVSEKLVRYKERMLSKYVKFLTIDAHVELKGEELHCVVSSSSLLDTIVMLDFLEVLRIDVRGHSSNESFPDDLRGLITLIWNSLPGTYLMRLHLRGSISSLNIVAPLKHTFHALRDISLEFTKRRLYNEPGSTTNTLLPFINGLASQIRALSIKCVEDSTHIWEFFEELEIFTLLDGLELNFNAVPYQMPPVEAFYSIQRFFSGNSAKLTSLTLKLALRGTTRDLSPIWLSNDSSFRQLRTLDLDPRSFGITPLEAFSTAISRCQHLEVLTIRDCDTEPLLNAIKILKNCSQLSTLTIYTHGNILDIRMFDALSLLSSLRNLTIYWGVFRPMLAIRGEAVTVDFLRVLESRSYTQWGLHDISIYCNDDLLDLDIVSPIAHSIPSLRCLWGQGENRIVINETFHERFITEADLR